MSTHEQVTVQRVMTDIVRAGRLAERFADVFRTNDPGDVFTPDVFFDLNMPVWRFQIQGTADFESWARELSPDGLGVKVLRIVPTLTGFVTEHEDFLERDGDLLTSRKIWLCEVRDGRVCEAVGYCSGVWDDDLRTRHAREAPMMRP